jgi:hypothetical protein
MSDKTVNELARGVLDDAQLEVLRERFGVSNANWPSALDGIVAAAFAEYTGAFLKSVTPITRAEEVQLQRLLELIRHGSFQAGLPTESQVATLFHLTPTRARTLLRNVLARFDSDLGTNLRTTLAVALRTAKRDKDDVVSVYIGYPLVADGLQTILDTGNATSAKPYPLKRMVRDSDIRGRWTIPLDAYKYLCEVLEVPVADKPT